MNTAVRSPRRDVDDLRQDDPDDGTSPETGFEEPCGHPVRGECGAGNDRLLSKE